MFFDFYNLSITLIFLVIPAMMNINNVKKLKGVNPKSMGLANRKPLTFWDKFELGVNYAMIPIGLVLTVIGIAVSVLSNMGKM